jgi:serpin B
MPNIRAVAATFFLSLFALPSAAAQPQQPITQAQNEFASDLYAKLRERPGNVFFSPYSISETLLMAYTGAASDTAREMARTLHLDKIDPNPMGDSLRTKLLVAAKQRKVQGPEGAMKLRIANALWGMEGFAFNPAYAASIAESFGGKFSTVNFADEPAARATINTWVRDQTANRIQSLLGQGVLDSSTRLVLTNAIYFKADWARKFKKSDTRKENFHPYPGHSARVDFMHQTARFNLASAEGAKILTLPYLGDEASMLILLPNEPSGMAKLEASLTPKKLDQWVSQGKIVNVAVSLPKFTASGALSLKENLEALGMRAAFLPEKAEFSLISDERLFVSAVIHKAFVAVDEAGTEAAAATAMTFDLTSMPQQEAPEEFKANRPFLFVIRADKTGDFLFMGRLWDPSIPAEKL